MARNGRIANPIFKPFKQAGDILPKGFPLILAIPNVRALEERNGVARLRAE